MVNAPWPGCDEVAESVSRVIAAGAVIVDIRFKNILRVIRIVLEVGKAFNEASATFMNEKLWRETRVDIAEKPEDFGPTVNAIGVGGKQPDPEGTVLISDGMAITLATEDIRSGDEVNERS